MYCPSFMEKVTSVYYFVDIKQKLEWYIYCASK